MSDQFTTIRISRDTLAKIDEYAKRLRSSSVIPVKISRSSIIDTAVDALEAFGPAPAKSEPSGESAAPATAPKRKGAKGR